MTGANSNKGSLLSSFTEKYFTCRIQYPWQKVFAPLCVNMQRPNKLAKHLLQNYLLQLIRAGQGIWACGEVLRGVKHFINQIIFLGQ